MRERNKRWQLLNKAFISTAATVALIEFSQVGTGLVDGVITSVMLGSEAMAAEGIAHPVFSIVGVVSGILGLGMQSAGAKEIGRGNFKAFNEISTMGVLVGGVLSLLLTAAMVLFSGPLTEFLGAKGNSAALFDETRTYILGLSIGTPALIMGPVFASAIQLDNSGGLVRKASIACAVTDIVLDWAAVKLNMGLFGMGVATSISAYVNAGLLLLHFTKKDRMLHPKFKMSALSELGKVLSKGTNMAVKRLANVIRPILINNYIIALGGTAAMAALSVKNNVSNFAEIIGSGITGTVPIMMGIVYGEKSVEDMLHVGKLTHRAIFIGTGSAALLTAIFAPTIAAFFVGADSELHGIVVFAMYMLAIELVAQTLVASRVAYLNVISKFVDSQLLQFSLKLLAIVPSVLVMGKLFGVRGVLAAFAVSYALLLVIIFVISALRKKKLRISPVDFLRLDVGFDVDPGDVIELDIRDMEDASLVSEQVHMFCNGHKLDSRTSYYSALALEEAIRLIFENNNFAGDLLIDIRVIIQNGELILRIRDNGKSSIPFGETNPEKSDDPCANIGLNLIRKTAKDINYYHTLKINYTIITV